MLDEAAHASLGVVDVVIGEQSALCVAGKSNARCVGDSIYLLVFQQVAFHEAMLTLSQFRLLGIECAPCFIQVFQLTQPDVVIVATHLPVAHPHEQ